MDVTDLLVIIAGLNEGSVETRLKVLRFFAELKTSSSSSTTLTAAAVSHTVVLSLI